MKEKKQKKVLHGNIFKQNRILPKMILDGRTFKARKKLTRFTILVQAAWHDRPALVTNENYFPDRTSAWTAVAEEFRRIGTEAELPVRAAGRIAVENFADLEVLVAVEVWAAKKQLKMVAGVGELKMGLVWRKAEVQVVEGVGARKMNLHRSFVIPPNFLDDLEGSLFVFLLRESWSWN